MAYDQQEQLAKKLTEFVSGTKARQFNIKETRKFVRKSFSYFFGNLSDLGNLFQI